MSYNFLEYQKAIEEISTLISDRPVVQWVGLCNFKVDVDDLCIAIQVWLPNEKTEKWIVICLKNPWLGLFWGDSKQFCEIKSKSFSKAFSRESPDLSQYLKSKVLEKISIVENDRIFSIHFSGGTRLSFEMFPARPNWILHSVGQWRESKTKIQVKLKQNLTAFSFRNFENQSSPDWLTRAYLEYAEKRNEALYLQTLKSAQNFYEDRLAHGIRLKSEIARQLKACEQAEEELKKGELLKSVLYQYGKNEKMKLVEVGEIIIPCDPKKTLQENADLYFKNYKKLIRTKKEIEPRLLKIDFDVKNDRQASVEISQFKKNPKEKYAESLQRLYDIDAVKASLHQGRNDLVKKNKTEKKFQKAGVKKFISNEGLHIWVGRTHEENEELVIRLARGNDLWFHLKGRAGAHAIVQIPKGKTASLDTMLDAAILVAHYSGVSEHDKCEVDYTFRKNVKRVPGGKKNASQFLVTYSQNKTLGVHVDRARLDRLFAG